MKAICTLGCVAFPGDLSGHRIALTQDEIIPEDQGQDPALNFETGLETGAQETLEDLQDRLEDAGFDPEEVEELLYDPAPRRRRRGRKHRSHSHRHYDPAPRRRRRPARRIVTARRIGRRGTLSKLRKFVMPGAAGVTFLTAYTQRAKDLKASGAITTESVVDAIKYDIQNFDSNAAYTRVKDNAVAIATPGVAGYLVNKFVPGGKLGSVAHIIGDALMGYAVGKAAKVILDPPVQAKQPVRVVQPVQQPQVQNSRTESGSNAI